MPRISSLPAVAAAALLALGGLAATAHAGPADTIQVLGDLNPGPASSKTDPDTPRALTQVGGQVFFTADDGTHGTELWVTDGRSGSGTHLVRDIDPTGSDSSQPRWLAAYKGALFFSATDGTHGRALWRSDGTAAGTTEVAPIAGGGPTDPTSLTVSGNTLFFAGNDPTNGRELWKSDGTAPGTTIVKPLAVPIPGGSSPQQLTDVGGLLFFAAASATDGFELYRSDGTAVGTFEVKDINPSAGSDPDQLTASRSTLYFSADDGSTGRELWRSDGTAGGASEVADINTSSAGASSSPISLVSIGGTLYFSANDAVANRELWRSDGTGLGTTEVKDINPAGQSFPLSLTNLNGTLLFSASDGGNNTELWRSDGSRTGTVQVKDINPTGNSFPDDLAAIDGMVYFGADDGQHGFQPWRSDGTAAGTVPLGVIGAGSAGSSSHAANFTAAAHAIVLTASDGTGAGTLGGELFRAIDTVAPQTTITAGPADNGVLPTGSASFSFASDDTPATFQCSLDGGAFLACDSPKPFTGLAAGSHTFAVRALDALPNLDQSPATRVFTVASPVVITPPVLVAPVIVPPVVVPPVVDRTAPKLTVTATATKTSIVVTATCSEACDLRATGSIAVTTAKRTHATTTLKLATVRKKGAAAGRKQKLTCTLPSGAAARSALRKGTAVATISVTATDKAGNASRPKVVHVKLAKRH